MHTSLKILLSASIFSASISFAADLPDAGRMLKESSTHPSLSVSPSPQLPPDLQKGGKPVATPKRDNTKVRVSGFIFTGNTVFSGNELSGMMSGSQNRDVTLAELEVSASAITTAYRERGYFLASVFFPPQTVAPGGSLIVEVVEGNLEHIYVETTPAITRTRKSVLEYYANQLPVNRPLEDGALTSMVMRTNELPNITSRIMLEPGSRPGTTKAIMQVTEGNPFRFSVNIDNYGNQTTGEHHLSGMMDIYSPFHLGDQFSLQLQTSTTGNLQNIQAGYTIPLLAYGTKVGCSYNYVNYTLGGAFEPLHAKGNAHNLALSLTQPVIRRKNLILNATIAGEGKILGDRVELVQSKNQRLDLSLQTGVSGIQMDNFFGGGTTAFSFGFVGGKLSIRDAETLLIDQSTNGLHTNGGYTKLNITLARTQRVNSGLSFYAGTYFQWSNNNLNSAEQLTLSGPGAVRAWETNTPSADRGMISTAEMRYLVGSTEELPGQLELCAFIDHGSALLYSKPPLDAGRNTMRFTGAGVGFKWFESGNFTMQATAAWPLAGEHTHSGGAVIYAQTTKSF